MLPSSLVLRLSRETQTHQARADEDRLQLLAAVSPDRYASFLCRIWGFEAPVEAAFAKAPGLGDIVDLRGRTHIRLLRADLAALGIRSPSSLPACRTIPVLQAAEALGWMYVVLHNAHLHGQLRRHLAKRLPTQLTSAGAYLAGDERTIASRRAELGLALQRVATTADIGNRVVEAARGAFQQQRQWFRPTATPVRRAISTRASHGT